MSNLSGPPAALLQSASLRRAIGFFIQTMSSAWRATASTPLFENSLTVTSFFRTKAHNAQVGGEEFSQHRFALAVDMAGTFDDLLTIVTQANDRGIVAFVNDGQDTAHFQALIAGTIPQSLFLVLERVLGEA